MNGTVFHHPAPLQNILDVVHLRNSLGAFSLVAGNNHAENEANFAHARHGKAVHEGYIQSLNYSGVASTDKVIADVQRENGKCVIAPTCKLKSLMMQREANPQ